MIILFSVIILLFSAIIHEYMHGWMAERLGDSTARDEGRLTLNPLAHIDPWGSILLPLLLAISNVGFIFGYAKPVPYNPYNLKDQKYGGAKVAFAGPLANLIVAIAFGLLLRLSPDLNEGLSVLFAYIVQINLVLMIFNLVPIPPLDGSKVVMPFLPYSWQVKLAEAEKYGMILVIFFVIFGFSIISPVINFFFNLIVGGKIF